MDLTIDTQLPIKNPILRQSHQKIYIKYQALKIQYFFYLMAQKRKIITTPKYQDIDTNTIMKLQGEISFIQKYIWI
ncbi:hypothetical protein TTHERM_000935563 (macronuclear) [Tetrahymena thermophila SB210]|uniref:Uncharacterized protein n=1 Tax=Tetrahymena thermophila (strain SB210) TaxID=312017 RepID=W7XAC0_TETTS|nr:hypothetical protein TTHERM_000935563 [Tetrahymena thermophila SB210]EWS73328.1 hypothetical protein TTHERM_000935563 [Tetrahymena thermophila SB210]|eukprot:XP_012654133.1 hypothetical protein TTHERM_000935563 [Tetrahymena thermophila SB210]